MRSQLTNTKFLGIDFAFSTHLYISCKIQASLLSFECMMQRPTNTSTQAVTNIIFIIILSF